MAEALVKLLELFGSITASELLKRVREKQVVPKAVKATGDRFENKQVEYHLQKWVGSPEFEQFFIRFEKTERSDDEDVAVESFIEVSDFNTGAGSEATKKRARRIVRFFLETLLRELYNVQGGSPRMMTGIKAQHEETRKEIKHLQLLLSQKGVDRSERKRRRGFIPNFRERSRALPSRLTGQTDFVGREVEKAQIRTRLSPQCIITVIGPPKSGKQRLAGQVLSNLEPGASDVFNGVALLYVRARTGGTQFPLVQSLARALEIEIEKDVRSGLDTFAGSGSDNDLDVFDEAYSFSRKTEAQRLLGKVVIELEDLLNETENNLIAVFAETEQVLEVESARQSLAQFLAEDPFHLGTAIICTRPLSSVTTEEMRHSLASSGRHKRTFHQPIRLGPLSPEDSTDLLSQFAPDSEQIEGEVKKMVEEIEEKALFYPGTLCNAGRLFQTTAEPKRKELHRIWLQSYLDEPITNYVRRVGGSILANENEVEGPLTTLFSMALFPSRAADNDLVRHADLAAPAWQELSDEDLLTHTDSGYVLTSLGKALLRTEITFKYQDEGHDSAAWKVFASAFERFLNVLSTRSGVDNSSDFSVDVEDAQRWVNEKLPGEDRISGLLKEMLSVLAADDVLLPFSSQEADSLVERQREIGGDRLNTTLTELTHASRYAESTESFLLVFESAVDRASAEPSLTGHQVRALDRSGFRRRHRRFYEELLNQRLKLVDKLMQAVDEDSDDDVNLVKWAASWMLNSTGLAIGVGKMDLAQRLFQQASEMAEEFDSLVGPYEGTDQPWIECRLIQLQARLVKQEDRIELLRQAEEKAKRGLLISKGTAWWIEFYHRRIRHYLREVRSDNERDQTIDRTYVFLRDQFGEKEEWPFEVRIHFAAATREAANRDFNPSLQVSHALQAINTLLPIEERLRRLSKHGDIRPLLVLARAYEVLFRKYRDMGEEESAVEVLNEAISRAQQAIKQSTTVTAWRVYLRLQDQKSDLRAFDESEFGRRHRPLSDKLHNAIKDCEEWLEQSPEKSGQGRLRLWCVERWWSVQGSLTGAMRDEQYETLLGQGNIPRSRRRDILKKIYLERKATLQWLERDYGSFPKLSQAFARLEFQYQRSKGVSGGTYRVGRINDIYTDALRRWPENLFLKEAHGEYLRHIWEFASAVNRFREIIEITPDGEQRRRTQAKLAESLLVSSIYDYEISLPSGARATSKQLVSEAEKLVSVTCPQETDPVRMLELCPNPTAQRHEKEKPHAAANR